MSGLCGWIRSANRTSEPDGTLERMVSGLPRHGETAVHAAAAGPGGLAIASHPRTGYWHASGEIMAALEGYPAWSDRDLAKIAARDGHAQALAQGYLRLGEAVLQVLHGAFSLALVEPARGRALLAVDRLGIQPLCHALADDGTLLFGSTTGAIARHGGLAAEVSAQAIFNYFYFVDRIPAPETAYRRIMKLAPGQRAIFDGGHLDIANYWRMPYGERLLEADEAERQLLPNLRAAMARCLEGERLDSVGSFLSGGLDSTTVVGLLAEHCPRPKVFTIGFTEEGFDETPFARISARHFEAEHHVYYIQPQDVLYAVPKIVAIYDEPFGNSSAIPAFFCAKLAREAGVETMLAGDGGDELFAGNARYLKDRVFDHYERVPRAVRRGLLEPALELLSGFEAVSLIRRARSYVQQANQSVAERLHHDNLYRHFDPNEIFTDDFMATVSPRAPVELVNRLYESTASDSKIHRMMHLDLQVTLADSDIRKVSRMCELAGSRVRYPFLDDRLVEYSGAIPPNLLLRDGELRSFYKRALKSFLPREVLEKEKKGFGLPYLQLLQTFDPLREMANDNLRAMRSRGIFRDAFLTRLSDGLNSEEYLRFGAVVWDIMILNLWFDTRAARVTA